MQQESVILLHGLARSRWSLWRLERVLAQQYKIVNQSYPSRRHDICHRTGLRGLQSE